MIREFENKSNLNNYEEVIELGCNVIMCWKNNELWLKNTKTEVVRQLYAGDFIRGFNDSDFDWEAIGKLEHNRNAYSREMRYGKISRWDDFIDGYCAFCWTLHPDGRYFADSDGYGAEDDDEVVIYTILNNNFEVVVPWCPMDVRAVLKKLRTKV